MRPLPANVSDLRASLSNFVVVLVASRHLKAQYVHVWHPQTHHAHSQTRPRTHQAINQSADHKLQRFMKKTISTCIYKYAPRGRKWWGLPAYFPPPLSPLQSLWQARPSSSYTSRPGRRSEISGFACSKGETQSRVRTGGREEEKENDRREGEGRTRIKIDLINGTFSHYFQAN